MYTVYNYRNEFGSPPENKINIRKMLVFTDVSLKSRNKNCSLFSKIFSIQAVSGRIKGNRLSAFFHFLFRLINRLIDLTYLSNTVIQFRTHHLRISNPVFFCKNPFLHLLYHFRNFTDYP